MPFSSWLYLILPATVLCSSLPNQAGQYALEPTPFTIDVDHRFVEETRHRVAHTRWLNDLNQPDFTDGPSLANATEVAKYWVHHYNWTDIQAELNSQFHQFTTTVQAPNSSYTKPVPLHFVHHRSNRSDAVPFLFVHGWPGSFLEVGRIISNLTNPPNSSLPAFHVVAPSIPGFGFSPAPVEPGFGPQEAADAFNALMLQLNYTRYVTQGGDFGDVILQFQAASYPSNVASFLSNFWLISPNATDVARFEANETTPDETAYMDTFTAFSSQGNGYLRLQATLPLQPGYAMSDSPLGFAMHIYALMAPASQGYYWTPSEIITWAMMYWIQGPYGGMRFYKEVYRAGVFDFNPAVYGFVGKFPFIHGTPVGITQRPADIGWRLPLDWARRNADNITVRYVHDQGGHFAAYQSPNSLLEDIWDFFGNSTLSGTISPQ